MCAKLTHWSAKAQPRVHNFRFWPRGKLYWVEMKSWLDREYNQFVMQNPSTIFSLWSCLHSVSIMSWATFSRDPWNSPIRTFIYGWFSFFILYSLHFREQFGLSLLCRGKWLRAARVIDEAATIEDSNKTVLHLLSAQLHIQHLRQFDLGI